MRFSFDVKFIAAKRCVMLQKIMLQNKKRAG